AVQPALVSGSERQVSAGARAAGLAVVKDTRLHGVVATAHPAARVREDGRARSTSPSTDGDAGQAGGSSSAAAATAAQVAGLAGAVTGTLPAAPPLPVDVPPLPVEVPPVTVPV